MSTSRLQTSAAAALLLAALIPGPLEAQSVQDRTPNLSGGWVGEPGVVHFNFLHRFDLIDTDGDDTGDRITNTPSFLLAAPLPGRTLLGLRYSSNALVTTAEFNEFEVLGRWAPLTTEDGYPVDAGLTVAYNSITSSGDAELAVTLPLGPVSLLATGRYLSDAYGSGESRWAGGGGFTLDLHENVTLAADAVALTDLTPGEDVAWGVGLQTRVPYTPHTFSLQATNTRGTSLQNASLGRESRGDDEVVWGFEFTIPFTLSRYFGGDGQDESEEAGGAAVGSGDVAAEVTMNNRLRYAPETVRIQAGQTVRWRNTTPLIHTVTADPARAMSPEESVSLPRGAEPFDSGDLRPDETWEHTFTVPGEYRYFCIPHEGAGMVGTVIVEG